jgi:hypothetical protein
MSIRAIPKLYGRLKRVVWSSLDLRQILCCKKARKIYYVRAAASATEGEGWEKVQGEERQSDSHVRGCGTRAQQSQYYIYATRE